MSVADETAREIRPSVPGPMLPIVYCNWVRLAPGPFDLALDVGYVAPDSPDQPDLRLVMTWEHAKILCHALNEIVEQRERNTGEIKAPPGIVLTSISDTTDEAEPNGGEQ